MKPPSVAIDVAPVVEAELDVVGVERRHAAPATGAAPPAARRSFNAARRSMSEP
ncbi:hypothetical protein [Sorangium sp. So ce341]|uniref:hypothetical protein n=1 Tax=Sorangium sp. So ce341 TaxID=3133302 RepID=UPI003F5D9215